LNAAPTQSILVVGGGTPVGTERLRQCAATYEALIAADAGAAALRQADLPPLLLTGDFDSITAEDLAWVPEARQRHNRDQSTTDLEKAIVLALEQGAKRIGLVCATGDRLDHSINAVSLMLRYRGKAEFVFHDAHGDATLAYAPGVTISGKPGEKLSLIPAPGAVGVRTTGLKYMLEGIDFVFGARDGISNEFMVSQAKVSFKSGSLLVYRFLGGPP
jgi:thiamine pyrophosphokinase